jgi:hypothetical protein
MGTDAGEKGVREKSVEGYLEREPRRNVKN